MWMFKLRGELTKTQSLVLGLIGFLIFIFFWWIMAEFLSVQKPIVEGYETNYEGKTDAQLDSLERVNNALYENATEFETVYPNLPPPLKVLKSYKSLFNDDNLVANVLQSIWINLQGYVWAILVCIPLGFIIGLIPLFRGLFSRQVDAVRYLPLSALVGLFVAWFGIDNPMRVAFLAFGIIVYLLPVIVQRIYEVQDVYLKTVYTLNATDWQTIKSVYFPSVMSKVMDDMRVLTAISWTYIIIAELVNREGGIGSLIFIKFRQGQLHKAFAILIIIVVIGFFQDQIFKLIDRKLFPHKNYKSFLPGIKESRYGVFVILGVLSLAVVFGTFLGLPAMVVTFLWLIIASAVLFILYGEFLLRKATAHV